MSLEVMGHEINPIIWKEDSNGRFRGEVVSFGGMIEIRFWVYYRDSSHKKSTWEAKLYGFNRYPKSTKDGDVISVGSLFATAYDAKRACEAMWTSFVASILKTNILKWEITPGIRAFHVQAEIRGFLVKVFSSPRDWHFTVERDKKIIVNFDAFETDKLAKMAAQEWVSRWIDDIAIRWQEDHKNA